MKGKAKIWYSFAYEQINKQGDNKYVPSLRIREYFSPSENKF